MIPQKEQKLIVASTGSSVAQLLSSVVGATTFPLATKRILVKTGKLDLSIGSSATAILASLEADPTLALAVTNVIVKPSKGAHVTPSKQELTELFGEIGRVCPRVQSLRVALDTAGRSLPIAALTRFFQQAPRDLFSLQLSAVIVAGLEQDFRDLEQVVAKKAPASWKELRLEFCEPSPRTGSLDPLLHALAGSGTLERVTLSGTNIRHASVCTGPSLVKLVTDNELKVLTIWGGTRTLDKEDALALVRALGTNTTLQELTLHARGVCPIVGQALARCLQVNTSLKRLVLRVSDNCPVLDTSSPQRSDFVTTATFVADALRLHNRTLQVLSLDDSAEEGDLLVTGDSHDFDFFEHDPIEIMAAQRKDKVQEVTKAFTRMLHSNPVLEVLWIKMGIEPEVEGEDDEVNPNLVTFEMDILLRLNRSGIRQMLFQGSKEATGAEWVQALESQKDDLNALNYILSKNPSLCCAPVTSGVKRGAPDLIHPNKRPRSEPTCSNFHQGIDPATSQRQNLA